MDSTLAKLYHVDGFHSQNHTNRYFSPDATLFQVDCVKLSMEHYHNTFVQGHIRGKVLIDLSAGCTVHQLLSAVDYFQDIIVLKVSDTCITEVKKWVSNDPGACDWTHAVSYVMEIEKKSGDLAAKDQKLKKAMKQVLKCDINKENWTDPVVLERADCLITSELLECISKDLKDYVKNLQTCTDLVKPGGHILLFGVINATYIMVGDDKMHMLKLTEADIRDSFLKAGLVIEVCKVHDRGASGGHQLCDYEKLIFVVSHKPK